MESLKRAEFVITGIVQGVGFRYFIHRNALELNLKGFASNNYDGSVISVVEGTEASIQEFHTRLKQGPSRSRVETVKITYKDFIGNFNGFSING